VTDHSLTPTTRKDGTEGLPARGYSWAPFQDGNTAALVHGGQSPRVIEAVARIVRDDVIEQAPWIVEPIFGDALARYCRAEARARLLSDHIFAVADAHGAGKVPQRLWESAVASDNAASKAAAELGVTPLARARLAALTTSAETGQASLETLRARGAEIIRARQEALAAQAEQDG
jgi:hypothetical protein